MSVREVVLLGVAGGLVPMAVSFAWDLTAWQGAVFGLAYGVQVGLIWGSR